MMTKDSKRCKSIDYNQLRSKVDRQACLIWGDRWESELTGVLMAERKSERPDEFLTMQECHNSGHALFYLSMVAHSLIYGKPDIANAQKTSRIMAHLMFLREFIDDRNLRLRIAVNRLFDALLSESPDSRIKWAHFMSVHWYLIRAVAERYGSHEKCFPEKALRQIQDVLWGRKWRTLWWWKFQCVKIAKETAQSFGKLAKSRLERRDKQ